MIAGWSSELLNCRLRPNRLGHNLLLPTEEIIVLCVRDPSRTVDALGNTTSEREVAALLQPVIGRVGVERPETLSQSP